MNAFFLQKRCLYCVLPLLINMQQKEEQINHTLLLSIIFR